MNPLEYSEHLTVDEARAWLRSERLRDFPRITFVPRDSPACFLIDSALVWSVESHVLFPDSCRRRVRELLYFNWRTLKLTDFSVVLEELLPFVIDRW